MLLKSPGLLKLMIISRESKIWEFTFLLLANNFLGLLPVINLGVNAAAHQICRPH